MFQKRIAFETFLMRIFFVSETGGHCCRIQQKFHFCVYNSTILMNLRGVYYVFETVYRCTGSESDGACRESCFSERQSVSFDA